MQKAHWKLLYLSMKLQSIRLQRTVKLTVPVAGIRYIMHAYCIICIHHFNILKNMAINNSMSHKISLFIFYFFSFG
jgi:hypothetical protein